MPLSDDIKDLIEHETSEAQALLAIMAKALPRSVEAHLLLATSHLRRLEFDTAIIHYRATLALDPKNDEALRTVAFCLLAKGDYAGALEAFRSAFAANAGAGSMRGMALMLHRLGRIDEAVATYEWSSADATGRPHRSRPRRRSRFSSRH